MTDNNVFSTIAHRNRTEAWKLLDEQGYKKANSPEQMIIMLKDLVKEKGEDEGFRLLASIHPDKELFKKYSFVKAEDGNFQANLQLDAAYKNCAGCAGLAALSADSKGEPKQEINYNLFLIAGVSIVGLALIASMLHK